MITHLQVKNFRGFSEIDVNLGPIVVLVGRNGAGKSAFIDVMRFVKDALSLGLEDAIGNRQGISAIRRWAPRKPYNVEISLRVETTSLWADYSFNLSSGQEGSYKVGREFCRAGRREGKVDDSYEIKNGEWVTSPKNLKQNSRLQKSDLQTGLALGGLYLFSPLFSTLRRYFINNSFYSIFPNTLRVPQKSSNEKRLLEHGENFASVLRRIKRNKRQFSRIIGALSQVVEGISDIRVNQVGGYLVTELKHGDMTTSIAGKKETPWFHLDQESDGTLRMLGMLVALYQSQQFRSILSLEEPENALHPGALAVLCDVLYESSKINQIFVTTQSPDLISRFHIDELLVVERHNGISVVSPIDEMQREAVAEQLFTTGDLLRIEGLRGKSTNVEGENA